MKTILKQANFYNNEYVEPFWRSPVVSDEEEHDIDRIYGDAIPTLAGLGFTVGGAILGAYAANKNKQDVLGGAGKGAAALGMPALGLAMTAGSYVRNKKILKKRRENNQPIYGDLEKAHFAAGKKPQSLPIRDLVIRRPKSK